MGNWDEATRLFNRPEAVPTRVPRPQRYIPHVVKHGEAIVIEMAPDPAGTVYYVDDIEVWIAKMLGRDPPTG